MRIAVRVDASAAIGTGHLKRCLSLAFALRRAGAEVLFVWRDHGLDCGRLLSDSGFAWVSLAKVSGDWTPTIDAPPHAAWAGVDGQTDARETVTMLADWAPDWVVIDHYGFDSRWHVAVRTALACKLAVIDDLGDRPIEASVLVDHNTARDHQVKYAKSASAIGEFLTGPRYALIDDVYANAARYAFRPDVKSIGVFMGGIDLIGASCVALEAVRSTGFSGPVEIVSTRANPALAEIQAMAERDGHCQLTVDLPNLAGFFARHDLQIGAGGGAIWERCCLGAPTLGLVCAENQRHSLPLLDELRVLHAFDLLAVAPLERVKKVADQIARLVSSSELRRRLSVSSMQLVDGLGVQRVAERMCRKG